MLLLARCSLGPSAAQKAEAGRLSHAIDALRDAPNPAKLQFFAALQGAPCATPDLCQLKALCVAGFTVHLHALSETARAKTLLATRNADASVEAASALDTAGLELARAAPQLAQCADAQGAAQRKYKP